MPRMRRGTTLLDLLLALVLLAILLLLGLVRLGPLVDAARTRTTAARLLGALEAARGAAVRLGTPATLELGPARWTVRAIIEGDTLIAWGGEGHAAEDVTLTGAGAPIRFGPAGLTVGVANRTLTLTRGLASRTIVLSRLGRVR